MTFGAVFVWTKNYGLNQMAMQRYCSMPSLRHARILIGLTVPALLVLGTMCCYIGVVMLAYFYNCDPLESGELASRDQLVIYFAAKVLGMYVQGGSKKGGLRFPLAVFLQNPNGLMRNFYYEYSKTCYLLYSDKKCQKIFPTALKIQKTCLPKQKSCP